VRGNRVLSGEVRRRERSDALETRARHELCEDYVVSHGHNGLMSRGVDTTRSVEDGIPTRSVGTSPPDLAAASRSNRGDKI
jgi:hypothetical protein